MFLLGSPTSLSQSRGGQGQPAVDCPTLAPPAAASAPFTARPGAPTSSPQLGDPLEVTHTDHTLPDQLAHHILGVDLNDDQCRQHGPLHVRQLPPYEGHQVTELHKSGDTIRDQHGHTQVGSLPLAQVVGFCQDRPLCPGGSNGLGCTELSQCGGCAEN